MIQRLLLLPLLLALVADTALSQVTWVDVRPIGYNLFAQDFVWPSATVAFGVAKRNDDLNDPMRSVVLKSDDEGHTWTMIAREGTDLYDVDALNEDTVFVVGTSASCGCAVIQKSTDAGQTWNETTFTGVSSLRAIDFTSQSTGYAVGAAGSVYKTTNTGATWTNIGPGPSESVVFMQVIFPTDSVGYATALYTALPEPNRLYKTTNAGATWTKIMDQGTANDPSKPVFFGLWATDANTVFLAGRETIRALYKSTNGGTNWTRVYSGLPAALPFAMRQVEFVNDTAGFAAGDYGTILRTTNGGNLWSKEDAGTTTAMWGMGFRDRLTGVIGGLQGEFFRRTVQDLPTIDVSAENLDFGKMSTGSKDLDLIVSPVNSAGLTISDITVNDFDGAGFELVDPTDFPIELAQGEEQTVTVRFTPQPGLNKRVFGQLVIVSNDARMPNKSITLSADATTATVNPAIQASASALDFGSLVERQTKALSVDISPGTDAGLEIDSVWVKKIGAGGEAFELVTPKEGFPIQLSPGGNQTVTVRYAPMAPTEFPATGELVILSNDPDNTELHISLTGSATVDPLGVDDEALRSALALTVSPNPVHGEARIAMSVPTSGHLLARLFDARGAIVATIADRVVGAGALALPLDEGALPSGAYTLVVTLDSRSVSTPVTIVR
jgi:photosystem II stability/assembly factor-like uncharacterized protein